MTLLDRLNEDMKTAYEEQRKRSTYCHSNGESFVTK